MPEFDLLADHLRTLLSHEPGYSERKMFGGLCFMIGGHMTCGITKGGDFMLRIGAGGHDDALREPETRPMDFTGRPMKGMIFVDLEKCPDGEGGISRWVERALAFTRSLPAKLKK